MTNLDRIRQFYFVDALLRRVNENRYDDQDYICDNLLNTYDRLIGFVSKPVLSRKAATHQHPGGINDVMDYSEYLGQVT